MANKNKEANKGKDSLKINDEITIIPQGNAKAAKKDSNGAGNSKEITITKVTFFVNFFFSRE